jgi:hypothetical protein
MPGLAFQLESIKGLDIKQENRFFASKKSRIAQIKLAPLNDVRALARLRSHKEAT